MYGKLSITRLFWHLAIFRIFFWCLSTDEYLPHTVLDCKGIDPQATTSSYLQISQQQRYWACFKVIVFCVLIQNSIINCWQILEPNTQPDLAILSKYPSISRHITYFYTNMASVLWDRSKLFTLYLRRRKLTVDTINQPTNTKYCYAPPKYTNSLILPQCRLLSPLYQPDWRDGILT